MKKKIIIPVLLIMFGCAEIKNAPNSNTTSSKGEIEKKIKTIEGEVLEINQGKDGYTAKLKTNTEEIYFVTISRSNLKNPTQYKATKIGEKLKVSGEFWKMNGENQITVLEIL